LHRMNIKHFLSSAFARFCLSKVLGAEPSWQDCGLLDVHVDVGVPITWGWQLWFLISKREGLVNLSQAIWGL
jgi:hypothetical protein